MMVVSYIIPTLDSEKTIVATIESILRQESFGEFEIIVVDNGSTDQTVGLLEKYAIQVLREPLKGPNHARNLGAKHAKGEFLAFVDSDVVLEPAWTAQLLQYMKKKELHAAQGMVQRAPLRPPEGYFEKVLEGVRSYSGLLTTDSTWMNLVAPRKQMGLLNTAACIVRKSSFQLVGGFSRTLRIHEDLDLTYKVFFGVGDIGCTQAAKAIVHYDGTYWTYALRNFKNGFYFYRFLLLWNFSRMGHDDVVHSRPKEKIAAPVSHVAHYTLHRMIKVTGFYCSRIYHMLFKIDKGNPTSLRRAQMTLQILKRRENSSRCWIENSLLDGPKIKEMI